MLQPCSSNEDQGKRAGANCRDDCVNGTAVAAVLDSRSFRILNSDRVKENSRRGGNPGTRPWRRTDFTESITTLTSCRHELGQLFLVRPADRYQLKHTHDRRTAVLARRGAISTHFCAESSPHRCCCRRLLAR